MDEHDPFLPLRFASRSVPRRELEEGEATDQLAAAIVDWADTTDHDRDDLDRWLRSLVTGRAGLAGYRPPAAAAPVRTAVGVPHPGRGCG